MNTSYASTEVSTLPSLIPSASAPAPDKDLTPSEGLDGIPVIFWKIALPLFFLLVLLGALVGHYGGRRQGKREAAQIWGKRADKRRQELGVPWVGW